MIWSRLKKGQLEEWLGTELLERIEGILPIVASSSGFTADELYRTENLARLFEAFSASRALSDSGFREQLLNTLKEVEVDELLSHLDQDSEAFSDFGEKVDWLRRRKWSRSGLAGAFVEVLHLPERFLPPLASTKKARELVTAVPQPLKRLKDYQSGVFHRAIAELEPRNGRVVLQMPTGSGKTRTAMELVSAFLESDLSKTKRIAWLAHSAELCDQAADAFLEVWSHYAPFDTALLRCWGTSHPIPGPEEEAWMWLASLQMAYSLHGQERLPSADLIIVDEAHKVLAPTYNAAVKGLLTTDTRVLGLTATPGRGADLTEENHALAEFFFNKKVTIEVDDQSAIGYLRSRGVLAKLERELLKTDASVKVTDSQTKAAGGDVPARALEALANDDLRSAEIASRVAHYARQGSSCLVFATSVEQSKFLTALLGFMGVDAAHLDGASARDERSFLIDKFRSGDLRVLSNFGVLTTGFDAPKTDLLCIARPTTSIVLYSQMLGRGLRGPAIGGTPSCQVIDVRDNIVGLPGLDELYEYFDEYYDD